MTTRHKWADVIIAFAEGKAIQFKNPTGPFNHKWFNTNSITGIDFEYLEWRVKPEKKTGYIVVLKKINTDHDGPLVGSFVVFPSKEAALAVWKSELDRVLAITKISYEEGDGL